MVGSQPRYEVFDTLLTPQQTIVTDGGVWSDTDWHHVAITCEGTGAVWYVDGSPTTWWGDNASPSTVCPFFSSVNHLNSLSSAAFFIGRDIDDNYAPSTFLLDDLAIWDGPLSAAKVAALARGGVSPQNLFLPGGEAC